MADVPETGGAELTFGNWTLARVFVCVKATPTK
jgi:hypothetical protein